MSEQHKLKIAIVHEWLETIGGAEKVTSVIANIYQKAAIFSVVNFLLPEQQSAFFGKKEIHTSFIQRLPFARIKFRLYLPLIYTAVRKLKLKKYDVLISSSHAFAHSIKRKKHQIHICYCHTPMRYIWDLKSLYFEESGYNSKLKSLLPNLLASILRRLDYKTAQTVDYFIANSSITQSRIKNNYNKESVVIYPPIDIDSFTSTEEKQDYYFTSSRFVCYKKLDVVVKAFMQMPDKKLIICGEGRHKKELQEMATPNIEFKGVQSFEKYRNYMQNANAFVFVAEEDFGIAMVEAQACGTPVIGYNKGGATDIVLHHKTGLLIEEQTPTCLAENIAKFEETRSQFSATAIRKNAERFSIESFKKQMDEFVTKCINEKAKY